MNHELEIPARRKRTFVAEDFDASKWEAIEPYFENLLQRNIQSLQDLKNWLKDWSELDAILGEHGRWIYVRTSIDTSDEQAKAALLNQYTNVYPKLSVQVNLLDKKFVACPFIHELDQDIFFTTIRKTKKGLELFREENIALGSQIQVLQNGYEQIIGAQSVQLNGKELTVQQAQVHLRDKDRAFREQIFRLVGDRKLQDAEKLDELFTQLIQLRHQMALNAGFENYMEFRFHDLGRFDYTPDDCLKFHNTMEELLMPLVNKLYEERKKELGVAEYKPWDREVDTSGDKPLTPFETTDELINKTIQCFNRLDPYFGERIEIMRRMKYLDLDSRLNKGNGGYNMT